LGGVIGPVLQAGEGKGGCHNIFYRKGASFFKLSQPGKYAESAELTGDKLANIH
jgi:hypothetical protein